MRKNIIVINEDEDLLNVIRIILETNGYNVTASKNTNILTSLSHLNPHLIIISGWLENRNDTGHCKQLKSNPKTSTIPIIITSVDKELENQYKMCDADDFINFPFEIQVMIEKINSLIHHF